MVTAHALRRHKGERGAAVFIVVLVIAMLTAIGLFAASSAVLSTASSGHERQMSQTHYVTEYAVHLVLADLEQSGGLSKVQAAMKQAINAGSPPQCSPSGPPAPPFCFSYVPNTLDALAAQDLLDPVGAGPGSLGHADLGWNFKVELTDRTDKMEPVAGNDETSAGAVNIKFCTITLSARGVVWPNVVGGGNQNAAIAAAGSQESLSAHVTLPCTPQ